MVFPLSSFAHNSLILYTVANNNDEKAIISHNSNKRNVICCNVVFTSP